MTDVNDLINALKSDSSNDANNTFAALMQGKINGAMDDRKIAIAQGMTGTSVETEDEDFNNEVQ